MFYIAIILWIAMLIAAGAALIAPGRNDRSRNASGPGKAGWAGISVLCLVLGFGAFAWSGVKSVPAKSVGVPVSLGHVGKGFYTSGAHETWNPFLHLAIIDETIQTVTFENGSQLPGTCPSGSAASSRPAPRSPSSTGSSPVQPGRCSATTPTTPT